MHLQILFRQQEYMDFLGENKEGVKRENCFKSDFVSFSL
jgi:hypothetical protein